MVKHHVRGMRSTQDDVKKREVELETSFEKERELLQMQHAAEIDRLEDKHRNSIRMMQVNMWFW